MTLATRFLDLYLIGKISPSQYENLVCLSLVFDRTISYETFEFEAFQVTLTA